MTSDRYLWGHGDVSIRRRRVSEQRGRMREGFTGVDAQAQHSFPGAHDEEKSDTSPGNWRDVHSRIMQRFTAKDMSGAENGLTRKSLHVLHPSGSRAPINLADADPDSPGALARAKANDLVTFAAGIDGARCANCEFITRLRGRDYCRHPEVRQIIPDGRKRQCCSRWDRPGTKRRWERYEGNGFTRASWQPDTAKKGDSFFAECERDEAGHCKPGSGGSKKPGRKTAAKPAGGSAAAGQKPKALRGEMSGARREGKGKDAQIVLADGSPAPAHIKASMVPPDWSDVQVSMDPKADVLVTARDSKGRPKTVYSESWDMKAAASKFSRIHDALTEATAMAGEIQRDRRDPAKRDMADCAWLMMEQGTRPGSEADNKGVSKLFGHPLSAQDVTIGAADKQGVPAVTLKIGDEDVKVKDKKARAEIARRVESGAPLYDSTFWLKSHGATTLEGRHVVVGDDGSVRLQFMGKESVWHNHLVRNPELAKVLAERKEAAGDTGKLFPKADYDKTTEYVKTLDGGKFTPKDMRTAKATSMAIKEINGMEPPQDEKSYKEAVKRVAEKVSGVLGNEPAQALSTYISPSVFSGWRAAIGT